MTAATTSTEPWRLGYRPSLDGLRGIAILLVLGQHAQFPGFAWASGEAGVTLFFVLSGFLITTLLLEEREQTGRISLLAFYWRRAVRLLPAFGVMLGVLSVLMVAAGNADQIVTQFGPAVFYYANWAEMWQSLGISAHTWSLSIEEQFYIVWPLLLGMLVIAERPKLWLMAAIGGVFIARPIVALVFGQFVARHSTFTVADALLLGCLLAFVFRERAWSPPWWLVMVAAWTMALCVFVAPTGVWEQFDLTVVGLASMVLVAAGATSMRLDWRPLVALGAISYGVYLWHWPIMYAFYDELPNLALATGLASVSILVAAASYRYIERPLLRAARRQRESTSSPAWAS